MTGLIGHICIWLCVIVLSFCVHKSLTPETKQGTNNVRGPSCLADSWVERHTHTGKFSISWIYIGAPIEAEQQYQATKLKKGLSGFLSCGAAGLLNNNCSILVFNHLKGLIPTTTSQCHFMSSLHDSNLLGYMMNVQVNSYGKQPKYFSYFPAMNVSECDVCVCRTHS